MQPQCLCGQAISFGRSNVRRCPKCHSLQVRDYNGVWIFEYVEPTSGLSESVVFIPKKTKADYKRSASQRIVEAGQYQAVVMGLLI